MKQSYLRSNNYGSEDRYKIKDFAEDFIIFPNAKHS